MNPLKWLVDRECHVSMTDKQVLKWLRQRLRESEITLTRSERRRVYQVALEAHHANQRLYELANNPNKKAVETPTAQYHPKDVNQGG